MTKEEALEFIAQSVKSDVDMAKVAEAISALEKDPNPNPYTMAVLFDLLWEIKTLSLIKITCADDSDNGYAVADLAIKIIKNKIKEIGGAKDE